MKTLLLAATLLTATGAVAAPAPTATLAPTSAPATYDQLTETAQTQSDAHDYAGAQKSAQAALALAQTPEQKSEALQMLGQALADQNQPARAREVWQQRLPLVADSPDDLTSARMDIAETYMDQEMWQSAADAFVELIATTKEVKAKNALRLLLAAAYKGLKRPDKAHEQTELVRRQFAPILADVTAEADVRGFALNTVGMSYMTDSNLDAAKQSFEMTTEVAGVGDDLKAQAFDYLGAIAKAQGREDDAKKAFVQERDLLIDEGFKNFGAQNWEDAAQNYSDALDVDAFDPIATPFAHSTRAYALTEAGDIDAARIEFQTMIDHAPKPGDDPKTAWKVNFMALPYEYISKGYITQKNFDMARATIAKELEMPDLAPQSRRRAEVLLKSLPPKSQP